MSNENPNDSSQPAVQPGGDSSAKSDQGSDPQEKSITVREFNEQIAAITTKLEQHAQGLVDKNLRRVDKGVAEAMKKLDELVALGRSTGQNYDDKQIEAMRDKITLQAIQGTATSTNSNDSQNAQSANSQEPLDPVAATALAIMKKRGVMVLENDPEFSVIDRETTDPEAFLDSVKNAISAKVSRMGKPLGSPAAMPGVVGQGVAATADLQKEYNKSLEKINQGDTEGLYQLQVEYRKKGLKI